MTRSGQARLGLVGLALLGVLGYGVNLYLGGAFKSRYRVDAIFARAGQNLRDGSDVKVRGVLVGTIGSTEVTDDGKARVVMNMFPDQRVPDNVTAVIRAKTLFGEKFVELRIPPEAASGVLSEGDVIDEPRTSPPLEVEDILVRAVPLLSAIDPQSLAAALEALAQGLVGNEEALRRVTLQGEASLTQTERTLPELERNLQHLRNFAAALNSSDDELLRALAGLQRAGVPILERADDLRTILDKLPPLTRDLADIITARESDLGKDLSRRGAELLEHVKARAPELPRDIQLLDGFLGVWISDLSSCFCWRISIVGTPTAGRAYGNDVPKPVSPQGTNDPARDEALEKIRGGQARPGDPGLKDLLYEAVPTDELTGLAGRIR